MWKWGRGYEAWLDSTVEQQIASFDRMTKRIIVGVLTLDMFRSLLCIRKVEEYERMFFVAFAQDVESDVVDRDSVLAES